MRGLVNTNIIYIVVVGCVPIVSPCMTQLTYLNVLPSHIRTYMKGYHVGQIVLCVLPIHSGSVDVVDL